MKKLRRPDGFEGLCAAAAGNPGSQPVHLGSRASEIKVLEVDAFSSVHDMIHAAINSHGAQATLRQVYQACEVRGRIAYKRSGGSRLITHNDHWKSQIRHALYTCDRFRRVSEGADLWMIAASFEHIQPQTTKVLIRTDSQAGSVSDESALEPRQEEERRFTRRGPPEPGLPFPAAAQRRKRTSRPHGSPRKGAVDARAESPLPPRSEQVDESSHIDHFSARTPRSQVRGATPPSSSQMDFTVAPSPFARAGSTEQSAWQRAARQLNSALNGSESGSGPSPARARSAEAESPAATQQLYALRSRSKPPPGFGDNPDPAAEQAAREAHARTTGPLKKRLKAAAKAAEMAATAASAVHEETTSTRTDPSPLRVSPSVVDSSADTARPSLTWRPSPPTPPLFAAPAQNLRSRGRGRGVSLIQQVRARPTHAAHLASLSSHGGRVDGRPPCGGHVDPKGRSCQAAELMEHAVEGADETDEGGSKRLLRSQAAAAAADLERDGDLDCTAWRLRAGIL